MLVVRFEDINRSYLDAINAFVTERFGADAAYPEMRQANVSEDKWYADLMRALKKRITFTQAEIDEQYESVYCRHFYSPEEITRMKSKWTVAER